MELDKTCFETMIDNLKRWYKLLGMDGKSTKQQVKKEIDEWIKLYERRK